MDRQTLTRRGLFVGGAVAAGSLAAAGGHLAGRGGGPETPAPNGLPEREPFHGVHQAGVSTYPQAHAVFLGLELRPGTDREALGRLMRLLTDDARRLTEGRAGLADAQPELAAIPARLTVTFGFGPGLFTAAKLEHERPLTALPAFRTDRLEDRWTGGDLLVQLRCEDSVTLTHALRLIAKDARAFATVKWTQRGFRRPESSQEVGQTQRNLMGQLDGTVQPTDLDRAVWISSGPEWLRGGTLVALRRIQMNLEKWDEADEAAKEFAIGRKITDGAPLTGRKEHDEPDFQAADRFGLPVIDAAAHIRLARVDDPAQRMLRHGYNYDDGLSDDGVVESGLLFAAYQADLARQFIPVQRRLAEADLLNLWTTTIGSAVFALPPGCGPDGWMGETLLA
ncbi:dye decolorizing peroxidase [Actinocorallia herbida]|uniref:Dye decolorizing peroxidase n=1 Tax=Actinocorallia herbida TaxID=58109 RepID=A0A3N1CXL6_9ACTN|nr:Dyp-type peroxidase [Actinocorallia herbida]ROO85986.1 dye decolorizing peroxidase [Actinocorallia herbida]